MNPSPRFMKHASLWYHSLQVILEHQQSQGGYLACPHMPDYQFSWFRDGAFIAYALTLEGHDAAIPHPVGIAGQWDSALKFHQWCARMILSRSEALERTIARASRGEPLVIADTLNARYLDDGGVGPSEWPEFQLDGPALWLWSLAKYVDVCRMRPLPVIWESAIELTVRYLSAVWREPCYDCWEERGTEIHVSTLAAIYAGLHAASRILPRVDTSGVRAEIREFILTQGLTPHGELAKSIGRDSVDANLLLAALPDDGLLQSDDPLMKRTIARIESDLLAEGYGVHRHLEDTYYGGGAWVLLGLWLAWHKALNGDKARAEELLVWAEKCADSQGNLPEQVHAVMLDPSYYEGWVAQRGSIAQPLLWSHAKYLLVLHALRS